jgi:hypothetical protein
MIDGPDRIPPAPPAWRVRERDPDPNRQPPKRDQPPPEDDDDGDDEPHLIDVRA